MKENRKNLESAVTELLSETGQLPRRLRAVSNTRELTWSQVAIMARLEEAGPLTTADLAPAESVKPHSMGGTLAAREEEGLGERQPHPTDGRQILYALTDEGQEAKRKVSLAKREWLLAAIAQLSLAEHKTLLAAGDIIRRF